MTEPDHFTGDRPSLRNWAMLLGVGTDLPDETDDELRARLRRRMDGIARSSVLRTHADQKAAQADACDAELLPLAAARRRRAERLLRHWQRRLANL